MRKVSGCLVVPQSCDRFIVPSSLPVEKDLTLERVASLQDTYPQHMIWEDREEEERDMEEGGRDREGEGRDREDSIRVKDMARGSVIIHPEITEL